MIRAALLSFALFAACANPPAPENPNSVPNVLQSITQIRASSGPYVYMTGGLNSGPSVGQTATFVVTLDDRLTCVFQTSPTVAGQLGTATAHRITIPGLYGAFVRASLPNIEPVETTFTPNFTLETRLPGGSATTRTGQGDPRFEQIRAVFVTYPTPCWGFG